MDPTYKLEYMEFSLVQMYGEVKVESLFSLVKFALIESYADYIDVYQYVNMSES